MRLSFGVVAFFCSLTLAGNALPASAATGIAWDQVTRFSMDGSVPPPNFDADFQTASKPPPAPRGGMFGGINAAVAGAMAAAQAMQTGFAERHYVAGNLRRTDEVAQQTATIVDCGARTITYLNVAKKTYRVVSMDQPSAPAGSGGPDRGGPAHDDGTRYKIAYTSQALGPKEIENLNTDGYKATMTVTMTRPSGESNTFNTTMTEYVSAYAEPRQSCPSALFGAGVPGGAGPMAAIGASMNVTRQMAAAMRTPGGDPRFTFSSSGPPLPTGRLDVFSAWQMNSPQGQGRTFTTIIERGNVHQVSDGDKSVFAVPPDFTKES